VTFDLDLEHTLAARWPGVHLVKVWWRSGHLSARRSDLRKSLQTDRQTDRRTDDGRLAIVWANNHSWNELKQHSRVHYITAHSTEFLYFIYVRYTPPTRLNCRVESRRRRLCEQNSQLAHTVTTADGFGRQFGNWPNRLHSDFTTWILIDIDNFFNNDVITSSLVTNPNISTAQEIVNWVTTADGCVHTADATQLDSCVASATVVRIGL